MDLEKINLVFLEQKRIALSKIDKSKKGEIDADIKLLIGLINSKQHYYTTSSCSGRIVLLKRGSEKRQDCEWLLVKHEEVRFEEVKKALEKPPEEDVWLRMEPMILHVCCRTLDDAASFLDLCKKCFKRTGIISMKKKILIEIIGTEFMDTIIARDGKMLITDDYLEILVDEANKKLVRSKRYIDRFTDLIQNI